MIALPVVRTPPGDSTSDDETVLGKVLGIGRNYRAHAAEMGGETPSEPMVFLKAPSALLLPGEAIVRRADYQRVDFEGELGVVIGRQASRISAADAMTYVLGYTCANDVTVRDLQKRDKLWWRAKGMDRTSPVGPRIVTELDPSDLHIVTRVDGEVRQDARTSSMVFPVPELIAFISQFVTLMPGDLIMTGTPSGVGDLRPGQTVEVEIEGIGVLSNPVVAE